jgi:6-phosphogluconolactonase
MDLEILPDADAVAARGAAIIAAEARASAAARGRFTLAVSGGRTPWLMLRALGKEEVPWPCVHLFQVDERVAPTGHQDRNLTHLLESLIGTTSILREQIYALPVETPDLDVSAERYAAALRQIAGTPPVLDLVHLGLGLDGHTGSLVPGDPVLDVTDADVAVTGIYMGRRRVTLTFPTINRARRILWVVTDGEKSAMLARLHAGDASIPAARVRPDNALLLCDQSAAATLNTQG